MEDVNLMKVLEVKDSKRVSKHLIACIEYQLGLFETVDCFNEAFASITLVHFISTAVVIGLASINLLTVVFMLCECVTLLGKHFNSKISPVRLIRTIILCSIYSISPV